MNDPWMLAHIDPDALALLFIAATLPFGLNPWVKLPNVHWGGGLAVIFGNKAENAP